MSPYKRVNKVVYKKVNGLQKKGTSKTVAKAKAHLNVLQAVEHNPSWRPTGKPARKKR